ncbi:diguanylate cyclase [Oceanispirochaeta crateris]|nr:diguanylate cyclase [Oceanispirochaeta crateris]
MKETSAFHSHQATIKLLQSIKILSKLSPKDLQNLYSHMNEETFLEGQPLFNEGDKGEVMYIVLAGSVSILVNTPSGDPIEIAEIKEGNFLGEMSIFDSSERSATCTPKSDTRVLSLKSTDFYDFIKTNPKAGISIMHRMLHTVTLRLKHTGAFISDMVTWGEQARVRAITDDFTGLYNRRFLDEAIEERLNEAGASGQPLCLVMIDLDHFGTLNNLYGQETGDEVLLEVITIFRKLFRKEDILSRYGGDEFTFLLPGTKGEEALKICKALNEELRTIETLREKEGNLKTVTASIGIACYPDHGQNAEDLKEHADKALYRAKEAGRDTVRLWNDKERKVLAKTKITRIKERNQIVNNILDAIVQRDSFLIMGHQTPDEDCISSMIAMGLLINKFAKPVYLLIPGKINENFQYLLNICRYNAIQILPNTEALKVNVSTVILMDTPKPDMRELFPGMEELYSDTNILKIEIDHHLEADSAYSGDKGYCFVDEASSASELVGMIAFKLSNREDIFNDFNIQELFSRNFVLAVLTGIIGDSKMGKYLKTRREKWFYKLFSTMFSEILGSITHKNSSNFSSMDEVFNGLQQLSKQEDECFNLMMKQKVEISPKIGSVIITEDAIKKMRDKYDHETIVTVARYTADSLAETSRLLSLVVYYDDKKDSDLIQFRIRRSKSYKDLDLRKILEEKEIKNGGGHPGAIGFRFPASEVSDLTQYVKSLITLIEELMENAAP